MFRRGKRPGPETLLLFSLMLLEWTEGAAGLFLVGATVFAGISLSPKPPPSTSGDTKPAGMTAEELLASSRILSVAASSLTALLLQAPAESLFWSSDEANASRDAERLVEGAVRSTFQNISSSMQHHRHLAQELDSFSLTEGQLKAFASILEHLADPRVQDLGLAVAKALDQYFQGGVTGEQDVKLLLLQATQPRIVEIRELWHEVNLGALHGPGLGWGVAVNPANLFVLQSFGHPVTYQPRQQEHSQAFWVAAATFEQARVLLLHLEALLRTFGMTINARGLLQSLSGSSEPFLSELLACHSDDTEAAEMGTEHDLSRYRRMACSIKYGSAGIDVIASIGGSHPGLALAQS
eukprot:s5942_g1.t1